MNLNLSPTWNESRDAASSTNFVNVFENIFLVEQDIVEEG